MHSQICTIKYWVYRSETLCRIIYIDVSQCLCVGKFRHSLLLIVLWHCFAAKHPFWSPALTSCILVTLEFVSIVIDLILMTELGFKHPEASNLSPWHMWMWAWLTRAVIDKIDTDSFIGIGLSMETYLFVSLGSHDMAIDYGGIMLWNLCSIVPSSQIVWNASCSAITMRKISSYSSTCACS